MKIAVLSDLHVYSKDKMAPGAQAPSYLEVNGSKNPSTNPIDGLREYIKNHNLNADYLLCAGDLCDKADPEALRYGWELLNSLKEDLGAHELYATAGNHDLDSRQIYSSFDAKEEIQALTPFHPLTDEHKYDKYWARHFTVIEHEKLRFLLLNSAAYHTNATELEHGRISQKTIDGIREELSGSEQKVNVLLVHHHPHKHNDISVKNYGAMEGGEQLIDMLIDVDVGNWLIIHGHKHMPTIAYTASSSSECAVVFSAGSFSATLYPELQGRARNQFYLLEIDFDKQNISSNLFLTGRYSAWDWFPNSGWQKATKASGLPAKGGFGARVNMKVLVSTLSTFVKNNGHQYYSIDELINNFPELKYLVPRDISRLIDDLERNEIRCTFDACGLIEEVGVRT